MKLTARQRWIILGGLLTATVAAGMLADDEPPAAKGKKKPAGPAAVTKSGGEGREPGRAPRTVALEFPALAALAAPPEELVIDPFRSKSWYVAPPPPPPPKPKAPPLPFQYLGKVVEGGEIKVFLAQQGKHLIARAGDAIDGVYTVEEVAGGRMTFLYQPLNERQILAIGSDK